jgi:type II restriction/modification system DNA methylase subunit YeeA
MHEVWAFIHSSRHGVGDDLTYNTTRTFESFPFPEGLTPSIPAADYANDPRAQAIAKAAARLHELRENWLNPPDLVQRVPEVVPGYPDRILPVDEKAAAVLKKRTLTNLYNERASGKATWLDHAHKDLDAAVAAAYGSPADLTDDEILERLFKLNQERAAKQSG